MKVSSPRRERILMVAGCLLAVAAIGGFSLFAQAPAETSEAPAQTGTAPPQGPDAAVNTLVPANGVSAPGTAAADATVPNVIPSSEALPGAGNRGVLLPSVTPGPAGGGAAFSAGLAPPAAEAAAGGGFGLPGAVPQAVPGTGLPGARPSSSAYGSGLRVLVPEAAPSAGGGMMGPGMMPGAYGSMGASPEQALDHEIKALLKAYRTQAADPTVRGELAKTLNSYVTQQFKLRQERREAEIKSIEAELARVKQLHESRVANQEAIIAARLKELLSTADGLGWDLPDDSQGPGSGGYSGQAGPRR